MRSFVDAIEVGLAMVDKPPIFARLLIAIVALLISCFVAWSAVTSVDEITRGAGKVIPVSKTQIIQSSEPGVVREIAVQVGQLVAKGDLIVRLDDTTTESSLGESKARYVALKAEAARLILEQAGDMQSTYECPAKVKEAAPEICENEANLLRVRRGNYNNQLSVLEQKRIQRKEELDEAHANIARLQANLVNAQRKYDLYARMIKTKLVPQTAFLEAQSELTETKGQLNLAEQSVEKLKAALTEAELELDNLPLQFRQDALSKKTEALAQLAVVEQTIRGASERVSRTDIRSPVDGVVNTLDVNTIGAYVQPGSVIAGIVPTSDTLLVEARISPRDVAFVHVGQPALIKISAYDFSIYGGIEGEVENVSADSLVDQNSGEAYYLVRVKTEHSALEKDGKSYPIIPGMVAAVDIKTGRKTILHYLLKPVNKARYTALRER